jgi:hypothetical protein
MLYYESHITIEPVFEDDPRRKALEKVAKDNQFKIAELLMRKRASDRAVKSRDDTFLTGHGKFQMETYNSTMRCVKDLRAAGFKVLRYKVEGCFVDSRNADIWDLLK